jgi:hypothetical protein
MALPEVQTGWRARWHLLILLVSVGAAYPAAAKTFCCNDDSGHRLCGDILPAQCAKRAYQEYNSMGVIYRLHEAPLTAEQRAQRELELARKKAAQREADEEDRRDRALQASYPSVRDLDAKRERTLLEANNSLAVAQKSLDAALARKGELVREAEFYTKRPMPGELKANIRDNAAELNNLQATVDDKKKEIAAIQTRFDDEKKRYLNLGNKLPQPSAATPPESGR